MKKVTLCIQNGHRNVSNGETGTAGEVELIDKVFYAVKDRIIAAGIELYYDDAKLANTKRLGNELNYFIALHFDGSTNKDYNGGFIDDAPQCPNAGITPCDMNSVASWKFAQAVADAYFIPMGIKYTDSHRTKDSTYYNAFNETGSDTKQFIIELGTLTNESDRAKLQNVGKIAELLFNGIIAYLSQNDQTYKDYISANKPTPPVTPPVSCEDECKKKLAEAQKEYDRKLSEEITKCQNNYKTQLKEARAEVLKEVLSLIQKMA